MANVTITQNTVYRARFQIDAPSLFVTESKVKSAAEEQGFSDVKVWLDGGSLPADWPQAARSEVGGVTAWVEGKWTKASGSYPSSGDRWKIIDYWIQVPAPGTCNLEGWTCKFTPCCDGFECKPDAGRKYGDPGPGFGDPPDRCFPKAAGPVVPVNEPEKVSSGFWPWAIGIAAIGTVGYFAWPWVSKTFSGSTSTRSAQANPAEEESKGQWAIRREDNGRYLSSGLGWHPDPGMAWKFDTKEEALQEANRTSIARSPGERSPELRAVSIRAALRIRNSGKIAVTNSIQSRRLIEAAYEAYNEQRGHAHWLNGQWWVDSIGIDPEQGRPLRYRVVDEEPGVYHTGISFKRA